MAMTYTWNENTPADTDLISSGDDIIRETKKAIRERMDVEHVFTSGNEGTVGEHTPGFITEAKAYLAASSVITTNIKDDNVTVDKLANTLLVGGACFIIDGAASVILTGIKGDIVIPYACTLTEVWMLADTSGSIEVDLWKDTYANFPPTVADTITSRTISSSTKSQATGLTTVITAGDIIRFNVVSCTTITRCTIFLKLVRTA